jgi:basic membrane protein A
MKRITPGVFSLIKAAQDGSFKGGNNLGEVGLAPFHDQEAKVSAEVKARLDQLTADLKSGKVQTGVPPAKP